MKLEQMNHEIVATYHLLLQSQQDIMDCKPFEGHLVPIKVNARPQSTYALYTWSPGVRNSPSQIQKSGALIIQTPNSRALTMRTPNPFKGALNHGPQFIEAAIYGSLEVNL